MIVIGHQLVAVQLNLVNLQTFVQNSFERGEVRVCVKNIRSQVATIEGVIKVRQLRPLGEVLACVIAP